MRPILKLNLLVTQVHIPNQPFAPNLRLLHVLVFIKNNHPLTEDLQKNKIPLWDLIFYFVQFYTTYHLHSISTIHYLR